MNFWPIFILFIYFFYFFFLKNFFIFLEISKKQLQILKGSDNTYSMVWTNLSCNIKWRAGGAPSPPGFQVS